jgi:UDP-N-acetylglucosamine 3-dehydrogenase
MGRNHARVLAELAEVDQVVGVDASEEARQEVAHRLGIATVASIDDLPDPIDAAVVAVPSSLHRVVGEQLLLRGVACLIEKPLAPSVEDAEALIAAASRSGAVATVGHIERFNPAILELRKRLDLVGPVLGITTRRIGPYPARIQDVGVRLDLLTHDIDVVRAISGSEPETIAFVGDRFVGANEEYVLAIGRLLSGVIVSLEAGWMSPTKVRDVRVIGQHGTLVADTLLQDLYFHENAIAGEYWEALATFRGISEGNVTKYALRREEPLRAELRAFLAAVRGECPVSVPLEAGLHAVQDVLRMQELARPAGPF